ncbi:dTMP kinase [Candidatus Woesearchaeota archaeon]|nr:dTMP kinase [Candidatus Woesearchaeota archaeon]
MKPFAGELKMTFSKGKFIVFEGIDGCGKGTQLKKAASYIFDKNKEYDLYMTREPTRDFKEIRRKMAMDTDAKKDAEWYTRMFIKDRRNHIDKYILPALKKGTHVLSDRYKHSTMAYQHTQGTDISYLRNIHYPMPVPDITFIFDCPAKVAFERRKSEGATDVFDKDLNFQEELRHNYLNLKQELPKENIAIIDSRYKIEEIFEKVRSELDKIL